MSPAPFNLTPRERLVVALDLPTAPEALAMAARLSGRVGMLKVGLELFCAEGPAFVRELQKQVPVFLDLKLHDIPTTVRRALDALLKLDPRLINVHAQGGPAMLEAAVEAVRAHRAAGGQSELLAVTVLTSLDREALAALGHAGRAEDLALAYAKLAQQAGCDGVVCSAWEAAAIREACGEDFHRLTPGIRPAGAAIQDQARVMTPAQALKQGSTWLVVGRPITHAADPAVAAEAIVAEMEA
ncbi:orotidine-5'-phosphate decarboxylase [Geothrix campi]|uniref:orotidine-5'-phosphate decarboxylase n=1 Tax=Geothrix campi TaxID=2966450 RepID=UPI002147DC71|nr:orotidine-5'-phosphate decarboxylase [Geothrix sp. SG10]